MLDNHQADQYFYQILVFTGLRNGAGTKSKVNLSLSSSDAYLFHSRFNFFSPVMKMKPAFEPWLIHSDRSFSVEGSIRFSSLFPSLFSPSLRRSASNLSFSRSRSLGSLNYLRIWHDNSGEGAASSWFLKYCIVRDLQTMRKDHFICQRWLAVEKDDGKVTLVSLKISSFVFSRVDRSNACYPWLVKWTNETSPMSYRRRRITNCPMNISGIRSSLVQPRHASLVFNVARAVSFYSFSRCF